MLRPTRRPPGPLPTALAAIVVVALAWPLAASAGTVQGGAAPSSATAAAPADRVPTVVGRGVRDSQAARGGAPDRLLERLARQAARPAAPAGGSRRAPLAAPVAVQATSSGAPAATSFGPWEGIDQAASGFEPPDPWVAVGPDDVVQTVNNRIRFTNREGTTTTPDVDVYDFFDLANFTLDFAPLAIDGVGDPRWLYDQRHARWLGLTVAWHCDTDGTGAGDGPLGFLFGAISATDDPTGDYYYFYVLYDGFLPDYPMLGTSGDKFTLAANEYVMNTNATGCTDGLAFDAPSTTTFGWAQMLTSPSLPDVTYNLFAPTAGDPSVYFTPRPAFSPQGQSNTIFAVMEKVVSATESNVAYFTLTGPASDATLTGPIDLTGADIVPSFTDPPIPDDPGPAFPATVVDRRPTDALWQDDVLTFAATTTCDPAGGGAETRACGRVTQLDTTTATPSRVQDMLVATSGQDTWYPAIGQSQRGILHVVYSQSSSSAGISSFDRYQLPSDAVHTLSAPVELADGGATAYGGDRWGDAVGLAQDPRDTNAVWQGNQYTKSDGTWGTRVSQLQTAGSTFVPVDPVRLLDSRLGNGLTGAFGANVARTVVIAGRGGIPADAVAITGNLTIVAQTQADYASLTPLPTNTPSTSTLNFPLGDNRANNVTSPLSNDGGVSIVYKAPAGRTAHFLLDVTGYFLDDATGQTYNAMPADPVRVLDSRTGTGLSGPIPANVNQTFPVAGQAGIPAGATAITGNLTVAGQTGPGFVTLATDPPPTNPTTSTINFPAGDTRANGLTIKLSATGSLSAVYKAAAGRTTHLILDVTGYYLADLDGARFVALTPGRRMDTRLAAPREGLTSPFAANVSRTLVIEPYQGVPVNATAITGNLTVVGQTRAGYASMTTIATDTPATSTLNFPLGDIRANGVTGPLSGSGSVGLVYKASGGLSHLILDLTGYFR